MDTNRKWISKQPEYVPDFIIGGAMKSGTTSLHAILDAHPNVSIEKEELGFFDIDDLMQHPDFNYFDSRSNKWTTQSMEEQPELLWEWYHSKFKALRKTANVIGEDSTSYLSSHLAAERIGMQLKPIKLIFILRHPTQRAISNYLHKLKSGRAIYNLEDTLRFNPNSIIQRSLYKKQLEYYYKHLPFENIKVVLFEDFIADKEKCIKDLCAFLNIDFNAFDPSVFETHSNKTKIPKYIGLQIKRNRLLRKMGNYRYTNVLPVKISKKLTIPFWMRSIDKLHKIINPQKSTFTFEVNHDTRRFLNAFFKAEMQGIDDLVKKDVYLKWFKD